MEEGEVLHEHVSFRGISLKTVRFYDVLTKFVDEQEVERGFPYGPDAVKIKTISDKRRQRVHGDFRDAGLFGQDKFDAGSRDCLIITEGEEDAMAAYEMLLGNRPSFAAVSIKSGAGSAYSSLVDSYQWVDSFSKIYICFDNDEAGKNAVQSIQGLFDFNKVYRVDLTLFKDANDYLQEGHANDFVAAVNSARRFAPDNIISSFDDIAKALDEADAEMLAEWPFPGLNEKLYGIFRGDVIVVKAPEGVGKTEFFRATEYHILQSTENNIGIIHLEESNSTTIKALAGYHLDVPATLPDCGLSKEDILRGYRQAVKDQDGRVHIHSSFSVEDEQAFLGNLRFLARAAGCGIIFLDHITWLATGDDPNEDERKKLDRISQKLKLLAKELDIAIIMISHVNDDGQTRGSRNISKVANTVIALSRDLLSGDTRTFFTVEKARLGGMTGPAGCGYFDRRTGKLLPTQPEVIAMENS